MMALMIIIVLCNLVTMVTAGHIWPQLVTLLTVKVRPDRRMWHRKLNRGHLGNMFLPSPGGRLNHGVTPGLQARSQTLSFQEGGGRTGRG